MRLRAVLGLFLALLCTGCGGVRRATTTTTTTTTVAKPTAPSGLRVGIVGPLALDVPGVVAVRGTLDGLDTSLVLVSAETHGVAAVLAAAQAQPATHFALVGASTKGHRAPNLAGLVLEDDQAALIAGYVAGLVAQDAGTRAPRVAWVGPVEHGLARAFARGVHRALPGAAVLDEWSRSIPGWCKEAALGAIERGAMVVMAHGGLCARAAIAGAHEQNVPGLRLGEFEFPDLVANVVARDAVAGVFHGGEDIVFGAASGAVGVGALDPLIPLATVGRARAALQDLAGGRP
jgi:hypothetical protein